MHYTPGIQGVSPVILVQGLPSSILRSKTEDTRPRPHSAHGYGRPFEARGAALAPSNQPLQSGYPEPLRDEVAQPGVTCSSAIRACAT